MPESASADPPARRRVLAAVAAQVATLVLPLAAVAWQFHVHSAADRLAATRERLDQLRERLIDAAERGGPLLLAEAVAGQRLLAEQVEILRQHHAWCPGIDAAQLDQAAAAATPEAVGQVLGAVRMTERRVRVVAREAWWVTAAGFAGGTLAAGAAVLLARGLLRLPLQAGPGSLRADAERRREPTRDAEPTDLPPSAPGVPAVRARDASGQRPLARARPTSSSEQPAIQRLVGRVLVVEDNPINQRVTVRQLDELGLSAAVVADGEGALRRLADEPWDAVLMDIQLPGMDGLTATRRWREREQAEGRRRLPMVAITANALNADREACFAAGLDAYIAKPARLEDLQRALGRWLSLGAVPSVNATPPPTDEPVLGGLLAGDPTPEAVAIQPPPEPPAILMDDLPLTDPAMWAKLRAETAATDPRLLEELMVQLRDQSADQLAALAQALGVGDWPALRSTAHRLKGSAGMLGLPRLAAAAKAVEDAAKAADGMAAARALPLLRAVLAVTLDDPAVRALLGDGGTAA